MGEPDAHRGCTRSSPWASQTHTASGLDAHCERAKRSLYVHYGRARHAPRARQMGIARTPDLGGADEG